MATELERLVTRLEADTALFRRELKKAEKQLDRSERKVNRSTGRMEAALAKLGSRAKIGLGAVAAGLVLAGKAAIDFERRQLGVAEALNDTAVKLGLTTTALQELRFATEQNGVTQQTTDMALQRFTRRLGEAAQGTGVLKDVLKQYGIAVRDASGRVRAIEDVLGDYAEAVKNAESQQERLRLANQAFDSEGVALVTTLAKGRDGLDELRRAAHEAGVVIDDLTIQSLAAANREIENMKRVTDAQLTMALADIAPLLVDIARGAAWAARGIADMVNSLRDIENVSSLEFLREEEARLRAQLENGAAGGRRMAPSQHQSRRQNDARAELERVRARIKELEARRPQLPALGGGSAAPVSDAEAKELERERERLKGFLISIERDLARSLDDRRRLVQMAFAERADELGRFHNAGLLSEQEYWAEKTKLAQIANAEISRIEADEAREREKLREEEMRAVRDLTDRMGDSFARAFEDATSGAKTFGEALRDLAGDLQQLVLRKAVLDPLSDAISSSLGSVFSGGNIFGGDIFGLGGGGGGAGAGASLPAFAGGGAVNANRPILVGERGPEIWRPPGKGRIIPNSGMGGGVTVNITNRSGADVDVQEHPDGRGGLQLEVEIGKVVAGQIRTPGSDVRRAMDDSMGLRGQLGRR